MKETYLTSEEKSSQLRKDVTKLLMLIRRYKGTNLPKDIQIKLKRLIKDEYYMDILPPDMAFQLVVCSGDIAKTVDLYPKLIDYIRDTYPYKEQGSKFMKVMIPALKCAITNDHCNILALLTGGHIFKTEFRIADLGTLHYLWSNEDVMNTLVEHGSEKCVKILMSNDVYISTEYLYSILQRHPEWLYFILYEIEKIIVKGKGSNTGIDNSFLIDLEELYTGVDLQKIRNLRLKYFTGME